MSALSIRSATDRLRQDLIGRRTPTSTVPASRLRRASSWRADPAPWTAGCGPHGQRGRRAAGRRRAGWCLGLFVSALVVLPLAAGAQQAAAPVDEPATEAEQQPGTVGDGSTLTVGTTAEPAAGDDEPGDGAATAEPTGTSASEEAGGDPAATPAPAPTAGTGASRLSESEAAELFVHANQAYETADYPRAIALYGRLLAAGHQSGDLYYDLGNAYLRHGELGRAIAAYRHAQALAPRDQDVAANLAFARRSARDALAPPTPSPVLSTLFFWHYALSRPELIRLTVVLNLLFWGLLALRLFRPASELLRWLTVLALLLLLAVGGSLAVKLAAPQQVAVVLPQEIDAHSGTGADTVLRFKLQAGAEVRLLERRDGWLRIALPDGQQAWIEQKHAEVVPF